MHRHYGCGLGCDCCLYLGRVKVKCVGVDVYEYRFDTVPPQGVCGGDKAVGGCDNLTGDAQCLQGGDQRQCAVGEET